MPHKTLYVRHALPIHHADASILIPFLVAFVSFLSASAVLVFRLDLFGLPPYGLASDFMVALILFGPVGVSSLPDSSSLCAAEVLFRLVGFFLGCPLVGEGDGSSNEVLSGITFYHS